MRDHFGLFGPCDFERAPTGAELLAGIAAVQTCRHSESRVLTRHVKAASSLIARFMDGNADDEMAMAISIARCLVGSGELPPQWTPGARRALAGIGQWLFDDHGAPMPLAYCEWGDAGHVSLTSCLRHVADDRKKLARRLGLVAQSIASDHECGVVLPVHIRELAQFLAEPPMRALSYERERFRVARQELRSCPPGKRFHRGAWHALALLVDRLMDALPVGAGLRERAVAAQMGTSSSRALPPRTMLPAMPGLPLGWQGDVVAPAGSRGASSPILHCGEGHLITVAPTGMGKGVSSVIPALLSHEGSAIVVDPKGENFAVTAEFRRALGQQVHVLDPFGVTGVKTDRVNPLERFVRPGASRLEHAKKIVELLSPLPPDTGANTWWYHRRRELLTAGLLLASLDPRRIVRGFRGWLDLYGSSNADLDALIALSKQSRDEEIRDSGIAFSTGSREARQTALLSVSADIAHLLEDAVSNCFSGPSTLRFSELRDGVPMTVYLVLPSSHLASQSALLRLWLGLMLEAVLDRKSIPEQQTLFLVDEAAQLGRLDALLTAITLARGYGLSTWTFWQDLGQLRRLYPAEWRTIVNNCSVHQYFGVPYAPEAADIASMYRDVDAKELMRMGPNRQLLVRRGQSPVIARRCHYLKDAPFIGRFAANPFHATEWTHTAPPVRHLGC
jgi:type IV secretion system protein VirD4